MNWPWVSRRAYDLMSDQRDEAKADVKRLADANLALREDIIRMSANPVATPTRTIGSTVPIRLSDLRPLPAPERDEMKELINQQAGGDIRKRKMMLAQLAKDRADNVSDEDIEAAILNGVGSNGVPS